MQTNICCYISIMYWFLIIFFITFSGSGCGATTSYTKERVEYLPGFQGPLPFYLETGYVGVDENEDVQLFYYFITSESDPQHDPLILWISGGPGCSSINGMIYEIGPIRFSSGRYNGSLPTLISHPYSWTKMANILFLDVPVGAGFSYSRTTIASHSTDIQLGDQAHEFIKKWLENHPEFISNQFYIGGDSFSGHLVPVITQVISDGNEAGSEPYINIKGYILGNPLTFPEEDNYKIRFANGMGLISDEIYKALFHSCHGEYRSEYIDPNNTVCLQNLELFLECTNKVDLANVLETRCGSWFSPIKLPGARLSTSFCRADGYKLIYHWLNDGKVREALHIRKGTTGEWKRCNLDLNFTRTLSDIRPYHLNLSHTHRYHSLIYSGDHDMRIPHQSTEAWIKELNYTVMDKWRPWMLHGETAGYTESYSNRMTYATIRVAGHIAPEYKPKECFAMFKRWISNQPL